MTDRDRLLAWMAGRRAVPEPALCGHGCGRPAMVDDGSLLCVACMYRMADMAARPWRFPPDVVAGFSAAHADVVTLVGEVESEHLVISWGGLFRHQHLRPAWRWDPAWPTDAETTLAGAREATELERLWGGV